jgi:hypothetical protein
LGITTSSSKAAVHNTKLAKDTGKLAKNVNFAYRY